MKDKRAVCISASNMAGSQGQNTSYRICRSISDILSEKKIFCEIVDLREYFLSPCTGCRQCAGGGRCGGDMDFNRIYGELACADFIFFISPRYAPIPAKLCMLLEKMEQIAFFNRQQDHAYQSELYGALAGIISYGGGGRQALKGYKEMVNNTIFDALNTIPLKTVPFNSRWDTGIFLPVEDGIDHFPVREYDWQAVEEVVGRYVEVIVQTSKSLHAIC